MDEILWCYHLNETSLTELLHSSIYFPGFSKKKIEISCGFLLQPLLVARVNSHNFWYASTVTGGSDICSDYNNYSNAWNLFPLVVILKSVVCWFKVWNQDILRVSTDRKNSRRDQITF